MRPAEFIRIVRELEGDRPAYFIADKGKNSQTHIRVQKGEGTPLSPFTVVISYIPSSTVYDELKETNGKVGLFSWNHLIGVLDTENVELIE